MLFRLPRPACHELTAELLRLVDLFPIGVAVAIDPECRTVQRNRALTDLLGIPPDENAPKSATAGKRPASRCVRDGREIPPENLPLQAAVFGDRVVTDDAFEIVRGDGAMCQVTVSAAPLHDAEGRVCGGIGVFHDITGRFAVEPTLRFLADASRVLTESLDPQTTLDALLGLVVPGMADWAVINLREDDGRLRAVALKHADPAMAPIVAQLTGSCYFDPTATDGSTAWVVRTGTPRILSGISPAVTDRVIQEPFRALVTALTPRASLIVPLKVRGQVRGALTAVWADPERTYDERDLPLFEELAARAAVAIEHARLYQRELQVATSFQRASLPRALPTVPGISFDAVYLPGKNDAEVGGDWYDAFALPDGRLALSIGDVVGSGLDAATIMGQMRHAIRAVALVQPDPATMLAAADLLLKAERPGAIATALAAVFDPIKRTLIVASAGHPGPMVRRPDGSLFELIATGLPLGLRDGDDLPPERIIVPAGALLAFYSDGLIESTRDLAEGERRLRAALTDSAVVDAPHPAAAIREAVLFDGTRDDVAILTMRLLASRDAMKTST